MALVFAAIGIWQYATRNVFWNPKVIVDNAYAPIGWFYRVNSVFYDPSIYGRFLVVGDPREPRARALRTGSRRRGSRAAAAAVIAWLGLAAVVLAVELRRARRRDRRRPRPSLWRRRAVVPLARRAAARARVVDVRRARRCATALVGNEPGLSHATGGRSKLVSNGVKMALDHPVVGVGVGGFKRAYAERTGLQGQGAEGGCVAQHADHGRGRDGDRRASRSSAGSSSAALVAPRSGGTRSRPRPAAPGWRFGLALVAIVVHSLFYNALFEDPLFWAAGSALVGRRVRGSAQPA